TFEHCMFYIGCTPFCQVHVVMCKDLWRVSPRMGKWAAGPSVVLLTMPGSWVLGVLASNIWSYAGDSDRDDVNQFLLQYFVNYNLPNGWYLTSGPINTANWEADNDNRWTIPLGGGGKIIKLGKLPINAQSQAFYNVEHPDSGPEWQFRLQIQFLFPR
ncbi:MAG: hypothetical protein ACERKJ_07310, partial [Candidatus Dadabacteria bacterium]